MIDDELIETLARLLQKLATGDGLPDWTDEVIPGWTGGADYRDAWRNDAENVLAAVVPLVESRLRARLADQIEAAVPCPNPQKCVDTVCRHNASVAASVRGDDRG